MTRSHKANDRDHALLSDASSTPHEQLPRFFTKSGPIDADPRKTKKDGGGKRNWGRSGDEVQDYDYTFTNARRHSNSSTQGIGEFKTKFEIQEPEPVIGKYSDSTGVADGAGVLTMSKPGDASGGINSEDSGLHKSSSK